MMARAPFSPKGEENHDTVFHKTEISMTQDTRWTVERARQWHAAQPWLVGCNYVPADACNQIEMWQKETFNPARIDLELGWAAGLGLNCLRVFLHDLVWAADPAGYKARIDEFLRLADKHKLKTLLVLFDSVWNPEPKPGAQPVPKPGVHNAGWVQGPGAKALKDPAARPRLKAYVEGVVGAFAQDKRVLGWDVWNEPDNTNGASYGALEPPDKIALIAPLLDHAFTWTRAAKPEQPLTSGVWIDEWDEDAKLNAVQAVQLAQSDIISFHNYGDAPDFLRRVAQLDRLGRPLLCTEYMARTQGSTFEAIMPVAKPRRIGLMCWGFVQGRAQTHLPWDTWQKPCPGEPPVWFHEILRTDGTPYRAEEAAFIRKMTGAG
jgi:hypothetical protein